MILGEYFYLKNDFFFFLQILFSYTKWREKSISFIGYAAFFKVRTQEGQDRTPQKRLGVYLFIYLFYFFKDQNPWKRYEKPKRIKRSKEVKFFLFFFFLVVIHDINVERLLNQYIYEEDVLNLLINICVK